jgi:solute carrier family 50 protein (sugar transporter)
MENPIDDDILVSYVVPIIGVVVTNALWCSSIPHVYKIFKTESLGSINPWPFPFMFLNGLSWIFYSIKKKDYYIFSQNVLGLSLGLFYSVVCMTVAIHENALLSTSSNPIDKKRKTNLENIIVVMKKIIFFIAAFLPLEIAVVFFIPFTQGLDMFLSGLICVLCLCFFYACPLNVVIEIIRLRDSEGFSYITIIPIIVNSLLWATYGFVLGDPFLFSPNLVGFVVGFLQLYYKRKFRKFRSREEELKLGQIV